MKTIKNSNGRTYNVLGEIGLYMLLQCHQNKEYIIAYNFKGGSWDSGVYTFDKDYAYKYFKDMLK